MQIMLRRLRGHYRRLGRAALGWKEERRAQVAERNSRPVRGTWNRKVRRRRLKKNGSGVFKLIVPSGRIAVVSPQCSQ
jgi:hypothetical protein